MKGNRTWSLALVVILALLGTAGAMATGSPESAAPSYFNYQGLLLDSGSSEPVADGTYSLTFTLYDHATSTNPANELWEQTQNVGVEDGLFNVLLGDLGTSTWVDGRDLWLGITVAGESEMVPRQHLVSVPYAIYAERVGDHDHLGETWSGSDNPLVVEGSFSGTDRAPLILSNSYTDGDGLRVMSAGRYGVYVGGADYGLNVGSADQDGVYVTGADGDGLSVGSAGDDGLYVYSAGDDGVHVQMAGSPAETNPSDSHNGFEVAGAQGSGLHVGWAGVNGVQVDDAAIGIKVLSADYDGVHVFSAGENGIGVYSAGDDGVHVFSADGDGLGVGTVGGDGVYVNDAEDYGFYVYSADDGGIYVYTTTSGWAGVFNGQVYVDDYLTKAGGGFKIDHPQDPQNQYLYHSFVESPDMMNVYNGNVTLDAEGQAWVEMPEWFQAVNGGAEYQADYRYQLTPIGGPGPNLYIAHEIEDNRFQIAGGAPGLKVSWQVTGIRHDPFAETNRLPVEEDKSPEERGTYLHPEVYGQPQTMDLAYREAQKHIADEQ